MSINGKVPSDVLPEKIPGHVGFDLQPYPSMENVQGGALTLTSGEGSEQNTIGASLGPNQLRELAARMLILADAVDQRRTILMVTLRSAWLPHQVLQVRDTPTGAFHYEFLIKSQLAVPAKEKIIIPG